MILANNPTLYLQLLNRFDAQFISMYYTTIGTMHPLSWDYPTLKFTGMDEHYKLRFICY